MLANLLHGRGLGLPQTNLTAASRVGTVVTASGTTHTKGSYATLIGTVDRPSYGLWIRAGNVSVSGALHNVLCDIAIGDSPSGGNEVIIIPDLTCGGADGTGAFGEIGKVFFFPVLIPSGVSLRARSQANTASKAMDVAVFLNQYACLPWFGNRVSAYGVDAANSRGTSVTLGNGAFGTWTQLGAANSTTSRRHRHWVLAIDAAADATNADRDIVAQLGHGPDNANVTTMWEAHMPEDGSEIYGGSWPPVGRYDLPAGEELWVRAAGDAADARGFIAYGID